MYSSKFALFVNFSNNLKYLSSVVDDADADAVLVVMSVLCDECDDEINDELDLELIFIFLAFLILSLLLLLLLELEIFGDG